MLLGCTLSAPRMHSGHLPQTLIRPAGTFPPSNFAKASSDLRKGEGNNVLRSFGEKGNILRWVMGKNLHVTLVAPWQEGDVEGIVRLLRSDALARNDRMLFNCKYFFRPVVILPVFIIKIKHPGQAVLG